MVSARAKRPAQLLCRYLAISFLTTVVAVWQTGTAATSTQREALDLVGPEREVQVLGEVQVAVDNTLSAMLVDLTNRDRARYRRKAFIRTTELDNAAAAYAANLTSGKLAHSADLSVGVSGAWLKLGENLGRGRDLLAIHHALMASPTHRANLLDTGFTQFGIAVIRADVGLVVVQRFRQD